MKDLHSHIMFGIDDGSRSLEESVEMLVILGQKGVSDVMLTPHYIEGSIYNCNNENKKQIFKEIKSAIQGKVDINIYLGNEVMVNNNLINLLKSEICTLNNSRYLLIELPLDEEFPELDLVINELLIHDIVPIIAHPERYKYVQKNYKWIKEFLEMGALFQGNYESLFGKYGYKAKKTLIKLLRSHAISFLGSDMHRTSKCNLGDLNNKLFEIIKDEKIIEDITKNNFDKVIKNEEI